MNSVAERLKAARKKRGLSQKAVGKLIGVEGQAISNYENARREPNNDTVKKLAKALDVNDAWIYTGRGPVTETGQEEEPLPSGGDGSRRPLVQEARNPYGASPMYVPRLGLASAGPGAVPDVEQIEQIVVDPTEYRRVFGYRKVERVGFFEVRGDSASPYYMDGERVPVEIVGPTQDFNDERIYVFRWLDDLRLKRLIKTQDGRVRMISLNPSVRPRTFEPHDDHDFVVWGEVLLPPKQEWFNSLVSRIKIDPQGLF